MSAHWALTSLLNLKILTLVDVLHDLLCSIVVSSRVQKGVFYRDWLSCKSFAKQCTNTVFLIFNFFLLKWIKIKMFLSKCHCALQFYSRINVLHRIKGIEHVRYQTNAAISFHLLKVYSICLCKKWVLTHAAIFNPLTLAKLPFKTYKLKFCYITSQNS